MGKDNKIEAMLCPVCGEYYFSSSKGESDVDSAVDQCRHCGWLYDLEQAKNPDLGNKTNKLSLNDYKKEFMTKVKANPNYDYFEENLPPLKPHKCPVCGEYTFEDELSSVICPICGWEDTGFEDTPDIKPSPFMKSLNEAIVDFKEKRKANPKYRWKNCK